jgi:hypothetical protein
MDGWILEGQQRKGGAIWNMDMVYVYIGEMDFDVLGYVAVLCCFGVSLRGLTRGNGTPTFLRHGAVRAIAQVGRQGTAEGKGRE